MSPHLAASHGLLAVPGIRAMGVRAGLKKDRPDVAVIASSGLNTTAAAVFTQNAFAAAPVHVSRQHVADGDIRAIVVNSGNANACTGRQGLRDALRMAKVTADELGIKPEQVLVCSTGRIGIPLPIHKVEVGILDCIARLDDAVGSEVANAILTTDNGPKEASRKFMVGDLEYTLAGICKGAGMIHPNMATMLAFLVTDATIPAPALRQALAHAADRSFNQISVDGDESTNDTAAFLATGVHKGPELNPKHPDWQGFLDTVTGLCQDLAKQIAADGEGATKLIHITVEGAPSDREARIVARAIGSSSLVKSAIHGSDPNWGRIVSAMGQSRVPLTPANVDVALGDLVHSVPVLESGEPVPDGALEAARARMQGSDVAIRVHMHGGTGTGQAWGCDLTEDYVVFNSAYTT